MRRCLSSLLLLLICAGVLLPLVEASSTDVPACCRRDGKHHCMRSVGADGFKSAAMVCPYRSLRTLTNKVTALAATRTAEPVSGLAKRNKVIRARSTCVWRFRSLPTTRPYPSQELTQDRRFVPPRSVYSLPCANTDRKASAAPAFSRQSLVPVLFPAEKTEARSFVHLLSSSRVKALSVRGVLLIRWLISSTVGIRKRRS